MALSVSVQAGQSDSWTTMGTGSRVAASIVVLLYGLLALSACKQGVVSSAPTETGTGSVSTAVTPAPLAPAGTQTTLSQAMASGAAFANLIDRQGLSWSVEIGQAYDAASGKVCKPLRLTSLLRAGSYDRVACSGGGSWTMVMPLRGGDTGPRF